MFVAILCVVDIWKVLQVIDNNVEERNVRDGIRECERRMGYMSFNSIFETIRV